MHVRTLSVLVATTALVLSGCLGEGDVVLPEPGEVEPTGRTVELRAWVEDWEQEVFPGYTAAIWAFCIEPLPGSEDAVEYHQQGEPCSVPGPTVRVQQGDLVKVEFSNPHNFPHTIHWHGQFVPFEQDGVPGLTQDTVETGGTYNYEFLAKRQGTLMYHCHVDTQHHVFMGLYGAFIVEPQDTTFEPDVDKDYTLVLSHLNRAHTDANPDAGGGHGGHGGHDEHVSGEPGQQNAPFEIDVDVFMINGKSFPLTIEDPNTRIDIEEGQRVRIRLVNIGFLPETMHLHGHDMFVTHKDGMPLPPAARYYADTVRLDPGERYDVVVEGNNPGKWAFHTHYPNHVTNDKQYPGGMLTQMVYPGFEDRSYKGELPGGGAAPMGHGGHGAGMDGMGHGEHGAGAGGEPEPPAPEDYSDSFTAAVNEPGYAAAYPFTVEDVDPAKYKTRILAVMNFTAGLPGSDLTLTLTDAEGEVVQTDAVSGTEDSARIDIKAPPNRGGYNATVAGTGVQASYTLDLRVTYTAIAAPAGGEHDAHAGH